MTDLFPAVGLWAQLACVWATTARCPGNCHRSRDFADIGYVDFLTSAAAVAPVLESARQRRVGETVRECVRATRRVVAANTNLGTVLLLAPLASVPLEDDLRTGLGRVLDNLNVEDARATYEAIRLAAPAGLGRVHEQDVAAEPTLPLRQVMALGAGHDLVAQQYADGFCEVFDDGVPALLRGLEDFKGLEEAIAFCHLCLMAAHPDSLIARKCGAAEAAESARRARDVLGHGWPRGPAGWKLFEELDAWLRAAGRGRNPGTTADLVTACLFAGLRAGSMKLPSPHPWSAGWDHERAL